MRNQMHCSVEKIETRGQVVRVYVQLAEGETLMGLITKASSELLDLKKTACIGAVQGNSSQRRCHFGVAS